MSQPTSHNFGDTLNALFKETYAKKIKELIPDGLKVYKMIEFLPKPESPGNLYHQPVVVAQSHGLTFASSTDDAFNLNPPVASQVKDAQVRGNPLVLRDIIGAMAASRAAQGGAQSFMDATRYVVGNMLKSITKALEVEMIYGQMGYGAVASTSGNVITVTTAEWAPGIWSGAENMPIEVRSSSGTLRGNANITAVDLDLRALTVDALPSGTVATDIIWRKGAYGNEFAGIHKIITNTGSLFNIDASQYALWKGNTYSAGSASLSLAKVERALALAVAKGLEQDVSILVNVKTWADLLSEQTALRRYDGSYKSGEMDNGAKSIKFYGQNGLVEIIPSIYVKEGYAYAICADDFKKVGSTDVTFERPGQDGKFFRDLENAHGFELRCFADVALLCSAPGHQVMISSIVNS